jgi:ABC-type transport system substrate-binding protein
MRVLLAMALVAMGALPGSGLASARSATRAPVRGGTLLIGYPTDMTSFDPAQAYSSDWQVMNGTLYDGLYQFDRNGVPQLDLAAAPPATAARRARTTATPRRTTWSTRARPCRSARRATRCCARPSYAS